MTVPTMASSYLHIFKQTKSHKQFWPPRSLKNSGSEICRPIQLVRKSPRSSQSKNQSGSRLLLNLPEKKLKLEAEKSQIYWGGGTNFNINIIQTYISSIFFGGSFIDTFRQDSIRMARKAFKAVTKPGVSGGGKIIIE